MAERTGATIVLIRHLNKSNSGHAMYRGGGSIGIIGAARAAFLVARDPDDETGTRRIVAVTKSNLAAEPPALAYRLIDDPLMCCARVDWEAPPTQHRAGDLLAAPLADEERTELGAAAEWLVGYLTERGSTAPAVEAVRAARGAGYSKTTLHRARRKVGAQSHKDGLAGGWVWSLPRPEDSTGPPKIPKIPAHPEPEPTEPSGQGWNLRGSSRTAPDAGCRCLLCPPTARRTAGGAAPKIVPERAPPIRSSRLRLRSVTNLSPPPG